MTFFFRGIGGFGYKGKGLFPLIPEVPKRKPDNLIEATTFPGQAFIYRLSGDINPLHIDPNIAASQKFDRPIIHGIFSIILDRSGIIWSSGSSYSPADP